MAKMILRKLDQPDESRAFPKGRLELLHLADGTVSRAHFEPGWRWSECVKPIAGTESCQVSHLGIVQSGRMHVRMDGGQEGEVGPGDVLLIPPGHDAWVLGDEECVVIDFGEMEHYAERIEPRNRPDLPEFQPSAY